MTNNRALFLICLALPVGCEEFATDFEPETVQLVVSETAWAPVKGRFEIEIRVTPPFNARKVAVRWSNPGTFLSPKEEFEIDSSYGPAVDVGVASFSYSDVTDNDEMFTWGVTGICERAGAESVDFVLDISNKDSIFKSDSASTVVTCGGENPMTTTTGMPTATDTNASTSSDSGDSGEPPGDTPADMGVPMPPPKGARFMATSLDGPRLFIDEFGEEIEYADSANVWRYVEGTTSATMSGGEDEDNDAFVRVEQDGEPAIEYKLPGVLGVRDSASGAHGVALADASGVHLNAGDYANPDAWELVFPWMSSGGSSIAMGEWGCVVIDGGNLAFSVDCRTDWRSEMAMFFPSLVARADGKTISFTSTGVPSYSDDDLMTFQQGTGPTAQFNSVVYGAGRFVAGGGDTIAYSDDGWTFNAAAFDLGIDVAAITYDPIGDRYMAVGAPNPDGASRAMSSDGAETWEAIQDSEIQFYNDVSRIRY